MKVLVKNLNVSNIDKNFKTCLDQVNSNLNIDDLLGQICQNVQLDKSNLSLVYRGEVLNRSKTINESFSNSTIACLYLSQNQELKTQKNTVSKAEITSLVNHIISLFRRKSRRNLLEKLLLDQTKLKEVLKSLPELKNDPFCYNFVQSYDLIKLLCDGKKAEEIMNPHPNVYFGTKILVDYVRELSKKIPVDENFVAKGSYTIDEMSEDEESQPAYAMNQSRPLSNQPAVSQDYLSAVLSLLNQQQRPNPVSQAPPQVQPQAQQPVQTQPPQGQYPVMDRNYFQSLMQQVSGQPTSVPQQATATQPPSQSLTDEDLALKLEQMHELGFLDDELNLRALQIADGNIEAAVSFIIENGGM